MEEFCLTELDNLVKIVQNGTDPGNIINALKTIQEIKESEAEKLAMQIFPILLRLDSINMSQRDMVEKQALETIVSLGDVIYYPMMKILDQYNPDDDENKRLNAVKVLNFFRGCKKHYTESIEPELNRILKEDEATKVSWEARRGLGKIP